MGRFSKDYKARAWIGTFHIANMEKGGLKEEDYKEPSKLADFIATKWEQSGKGRVCGVSVCISESGCYHAHMALYGNLSTLGNVSKVMCDAHIEPQMGGKKELKGYLLKEPPYDEKGEKVLYTIGIENIQDTKRKRTDLDDIADLIDKGYTPNEIMENFKYRRYEKMIKSAYIDKRIKDTPIIKDMHNEWHVGQSGSGKTFYYTKLCEKYSREQIYMATDFENGGFDFYIEQGAPPIIFMDEFKGNMRFSQLLTILDKYSRTQIHCRYTNTYCLWNSCIITSIFPPDEVYSMMVDDDKKSRDKIEQLLRRLDLVVYHYIEDGKYKTYSIPASEYINYEDLKRRALADKEGFIKVSDSDILPFQ